MTELDKVSLLKSLLQIKDNTEDDTLFNLLTLAEKEIIAWRFNGDTSKKLEKEYEMTQIHAVAAGYSIIGAEGQSLHIENGTHRDFVYPDMLHYIHSNVIPFVKVIGA